MKHIKKITALSLLAASMAFTAPLAQAQTPIQSQAEQKAAEKEKGYAGDIAPKKANELFQKGEAIIVDVRTDAERHWVGYVPEAKAASWRNSPDMALNPDFDEQIKKIAKEANGKPLLMLCRTGSRSVAAAKRATELGITAYSVEGGFEGKPNDKGHRGTKEGWKYEGLPWKQD